MKKKFLLILVMLLAVGLLLPSYAYEHGKFYESGDLTTQGTVVYNQSESEMNDSLKAAGCDSMETMYNKITSMKSEAEITAYLREQADKMEKTTGCIMEFVFNDEGTAYSSNVDDAVYVSKIDTDFTEARNKKVASLNNAHNQFLGVYDMGDSNSSSSSSSSNYEEEEEEDSHTCEPYTYTYTTSHQHSHMDEGSAATQRDSTPLTVSVKPNTQIEPLNVGYSFTLAGNKHIIRNFIQNVGHPVGVCPWVKVEEYASCIYCSPDVHQYIIGSCDKTYSYTVYTTPIYMDTYHDLTISFKGFRADGTTSISGEAKSAYGTFPAKGQETYSSSFIVKELITDELTYDRQTGFSYGTATVSCSCGTSVTQKIYFDLMKPPIEDEDVYSLTVATDGGGQVRMDNGDFADKVTKEKIMINGRTDIEAKADDGYKFDGWYQIDKEKYSSSSSTSVVQPGYDYILKAKFKPEDPNKYSITIYSDGNGLVGVDDVWSDRDNQSVSVIVEEQDVVSICSTPDDKYTIDYWAKIVDGEEIVFTGDEDFSLTVDGDYTFIAHFKTDEIGYKTLTVTHDGNGYTIGGTKYAIVGKKYPIWSFPNPGYEFDRWEDNLAPNGITTLAQHDFVIMPFKNYTVKAYFVPDGTSERSTLEIISDGNGTVYIDNNEPSLKDSINDENGSEHDIHAIPNEGYEFENWVDIDGNIIFDESDERVSLTEDVTYTAHFVPIEDNTHRLDVESDGNGEVTGGTEYAKPNKKYPITATPDDGYRFDYWEKITEGSSEKTKLPANTSFTMLDEDVKLVAHFEEEDIPIPDDPEYQLTVKSSTGGSSTGSGKYYEGDSVEAIATANLGYQFLEWQDEDGNILSKSSHYSFYMPAHDYTIKAIFVSQPYNNAENISFQIVSIRDIRWKDYFTGNGSYSYKYLNIPLYISGNEILVNEVDLEDNSYAGNREIVYGYAVENRIQTTGLKATNDIGLRIKYKLYGDGTDITNQVSDPDEYLKLEFYYGDNKSSFLTSSAKSTVSVGGQSCDTIMWSWITYLPIDMTTYDGKLLYEKYNEITVEYDIKVMKGNVELYDYIDAINHRSDSYGGSAWKGKVFTYRCDKTLLDDIYDNANN